ncbi:MAG: hypothetical protein R6V17_02690 [Halanaerobacter sp.]
MKKISDNYLKVFAKIYSTERIKEKTEDRISWESQYLKSLREVVNNESKEPKVWWDKLNAFNLSEFEWERSPLFHYLLNLLKKESK